MHNAGTNKNKGLPVSADSPNSQHTLYIIVISCIIILHRAPAAVGTPYSCVLRGNWKRVLW